MILSKTKIYLFFLLTITSALHLSAQEVKLLPKNQHPYDTIEMNIKYDTTYKDSKKIITITKHVVVKEPPDTIIIYESPEEIIDTQKSVIRKTHNPVKSSKTSKIKKENHFSAGLTFSTFIFANHFSSKDPAAAIYNDYRKNNENPLPSFSISLPIRYDFYKWRIQSGLQYSLLRNKDAYPYQTEKLLQTWHNTSYYEEFCLEGNPDIWINTGVIPDTNLVPVKDSVLLSDTLHENQTNNGIQYFHFIEIPLIFGYEALHWKKLKIDINAGIIASLLVYRKGEIVSYNGFPKFINLSGYPFVKASFYGYLGLSLHYAISNTISVEINPYFTKGFSSILKKSFPVSQTLNRQGISVGLHYKF